MRALDLFYGADGAARPLQYERAVCLTGSERALAKTLIAKNHYTRSVPSGKSYYVAFRSALVVWSIPANKNIARFILPSDDSVVWELSRLWAPDGHERNLLTKAISEAVSVIVSKERPDALVSYADPNVGHTGHVYKAASWIFHGRSDESRVYERDGVRLARRAFHSGGNSMTKSEIEAAGYREASALGKLRFVRPISRRARQFIAQHATPQPINGRAKCNPDA